ncbi:hypothetical protein IFM89_035497 [Coptis chinensis]|uniref:Small auxin up regulated protein n=1 Tax=Coptis chinensis TaxID=261450 RepID=A0A835HS00_9MAGN|nr:hypothetical protein IFM89_035497 [Coptis chinensis]
MAFGLPAIISRPKRSLRRSLSNSENLIVPKGHIGIYVGVSQQKRFVVPISYLNHPLFLDLLNQAEEEFGFNHPMGGLTIPCDEETFINITVQKLCRRGAEIGRAPYASTWNILAMEYLKDKQMKRGVEMLKKALSVGRQGWKPAPVTVYSCLEYYEEQRDVEEQRSL